MSAGNGKIKMPSFNDSFRQAMRLLYQGRIQEAATLLEPLYKRDPNNVEVAKNLSAGYILLKRYDEAQALLEKVVQIEPDNAEIWVNLGAARLGPLEKSSTQQQDLAIEAYHQALAVNPDVPNVHYMLGLIYRQRKEYLRAIAHFSRALEQDPNDKDARNMLDDFEY